MKKIMMLLAIVLCLSVFAGCAKELPQPPSIEQADGIRFMQFRWDGYGITAKIVEDGPMADTIVDELAGLRETGKTVKKISDETVNMDSGVLPVDGGTMWLEVGGLIYRLSPDLSTICRVDRHLGKGDVLEMTDSLKGMIRDAWHYHPYDYYIGTYERSTDRIELRHAYLAESSVQISIKDIEIQNQIDPTNTLTIELLSTVAQTLSVGLTCQQSDDNLAVGDSREVTMTPGTPVTVSLNFGGWKDYTYWVYITADNTRIELEIKP